MARPLSGTRPTGSAALKMLREEHCMSAMELAYHAGINLSTLSYLESGRSKIGNMRLDTAAHLAQALGMSMNDFLSYLGYGTDDEEGPDD